MSEQGGSSIISTSDLVKTYGDLKALKDLNLSIPPGPVGLLGPNGAGKSTLIKCLLGLVEATSGESTILGHSSNELAQRLESRKKVGYVPENDCLISSMNALVFVKYMGEISGLPPSDSMQRAHEVLHYVGIGDERYRKISTYSTGMKQKVKLAQAMVHDPELVILDEPTNGMDPRGRQEMLDLVKDISDSHGKNILFSSHLLPDVEYICDHVLILDQGKIVEEGSIEALKGEIAHYEIRIKGDEDAFVSVLKDLDINFEKAGSFFRVPFEEGLLDALYMGIEDLEIQIRHATKSTMTLEDLFVKHVKGGSGDNER
jgi:ABC-2 type transport system ATP-binding protein